MTLEKWNQIEWPVAPQIGYQKGPTMSVCFGIEHAQTINLFGGPNDIDFDTYPQLNLARLAINGLWQLPLRSIRHPLASW